MQTFDIQFIDSINAVTPQAWDALAASDYPFTQHRFLELLEQCAITTAASGWQPYHLVMFDNTKQRKEMQLIAAVPLFIKAHSYGEFVFDHTWAQFYQSHGFNYYPKFLSAIPYTPVEGPRILIHPHYTIEQLLPDILRAINQRAKILNISSLHILFTQQALSKQLNTHRLHLRYNVNFHWYNQGFTDFDDYLSHFKSRKRKNVLKERRVVKEQSIRLLSLSGDAISAEHWPVFYDFYRATYIKHSGHEGYLSLDFFKALGRIMSDQLLLVFALDRFENYIAGALYFKDKQHLYGRYWGSKEDYNYLHFEVCYYQGIDYCIENKIKHFDPGVQGEHKIQRGFRPVISYSNHLLFNELFAQRIAKAIKQENNYMQSYLQKTRSFLPFKVE